VVQLSRRAAAIATALLVVALALAFPAIALANDGGEAGMPNALAGPAALLAAAAAAAAAALASATNAADQRFNDFKRWFQGPTPPGWVPGQGYEHGAPYATPGAAESPMPRQEGH